MRTVKAGKTPDREASLEGASLKDWGIREGDRSDHERLDPRQGPGRPRQGGSRVTAPCTGLSRRGDKGRKDLSPTADRKPGPEGAHTHSGDVARRRKTTLGEWATGSSEDVRSVEGSQDVRRQVKRAFGSVEHEAERPRQEASGSAGPNGHAKSGAEGRR